METVVRPVGPHRATTTIIHLFTLRGERWTDRGAHERQDGESAILERLSVLEDHGSGGGNAALELDVVSVMHGRPDADVGLDRVEAKHLAEGVGGLEGLLLHRLAEGTTVRVATAILSHGKGLNGAEDGCGDVEVIIGYGGMSIVQVGSGHFGHHHSDGAGSD